MASVQEAKLAQPPSPDELRNFDGCVSLQLADSPPQQALAVIKAGHRAV